MRAHPYPRRELPPPFTDSHLTLNLHMVVGQLFQGLRRPGKVIFNFQGPNISLPGRCGAYVVQLGLGVH